MKLQETCISHIYSGHEVARNPVFHIFTADIKLHEPRIYSGHENARNLYFTHLQRTLKCKKPIFIHLQSTRGCKKPVFHTFASDMKM